MAFEKAKVIKAAEKFLSQGKINAAIKEYRQIIDNDDGDLTTLNMLGDLIGAHRRKRRSGFLLSAHRGTLSRTGIQAEGYRDVPEDRKLKPRDPAIAKELGDLYAGPGFDRRRPHAVSRSRRCLHPRRPSRQTLKVLHRIADLDPNNTEVRLKLAGRLSQGEHVNEAAKAFSDAATRLLEGSQFEKSLQAYSKTLALRPHDRVALKGLVAAARGLGYG